MVLFKTVFCVSIVFILIMRRISSEEQLLETGVEDTLEPTPREQCYPELGCFGLEYPWISKEKPFMRLPDHPEDINTTFFLSTRKYQGSRRQELKSWPQISLNDTDWDPRRWTVIVAHGFLASVSSPWVRHLEAALLDLKDMNVVSCDWRKGSSGVNYVRAAVNTRVVGAEVARFITYLLDHNLASKDRIHLIGQSLGAHLLSYVSDKVKNIARLTALDAAQPGFENAHPDTRLDASDAQLVDVIHTSADHFVTSLGLGMIKPIGHVDFFVNGGKKQPGCWVNRGIVQTLATIPDHIINKFADVLGCSHQKAQVYYTEALRSNCSFWGRRLNLTEEINIKTCNLHTCQQLGRFTPLLPARGVFYVKTNTEAPYCIPDPFSDYVMGYHRFGRTKQKYEEDIFGGI